MKEDSISKIQQLCQVYQRKQTKKGIRVSGPYWHGFWYENGRNRKVYIGKEIPEFLQYLLDKRKRMSNGRWRWHKAYRGSKKTRSTQGVKRLHA